VGAGVRCKSENEWGVLSSRPVLSASRGWGGPVRAKTTTKKCSNLVTCFGKGVGEVRDHAYWGR